MTPLKLVFTAACIVWASAGLTQPTHVVTDPERTFKEVKEYMIREEYALAYPLVKELMQMYPDNSISNHTYLNEDTRFYYIEILLPQ